MGNIFISALQMLWGQRSVCTDNRMELPCKIARYRNIRQASFARNIVEQSRIGSFFIRNYKKSKVTVLSPHPGSELCSADFDKYLPWSLGLHTPYPFGYPSQLPGEYAAAHTQLGATAYKSAFTGTHSAPGSREAMQREEPCSGAQRADARTGCRTRDLT